MIEFSIMNEFAVESKGIIDDTNYQQFGFIAFGACSLESWENDDLFGANGTEVKYTSQAGWNYSPMCYWQKGSYDFAGVMPSLLFAATNKHSDTTQPGTFTASLDDNTHNILTLDLGEGYNLATGQHDLMVAFDNNIDNNDRAMGTVVNGKLKQVSFLFEHQFSLVNIKAANLETSTDITIEEIKVYGNSSTVGDMVIIYNAGEITASYETLSPTDENNVYKTITRPTANVTTGTDWILASNVSNTSYENLVSNLLVIPEECSFGISVTYKDRLGKSYTKKGILNVEWESGKMYTYTFTISLDKITFAAPTIEAWPSTSVKMDTDIEM